MIKWCSVIIMCLFFITVLRIPSGSFGTEQGSDEPAGVYFAGGTGDISDPYQISNVTHLQNISSDLMAHYILINNISASATSTWNGGAGFIPLGSSAKEFFGSLSGNGYTISGLVINHPGTDGVGLFGYTGFGSKIADLVLKGNITGRAEVGALVGNSQSEIYNCTTYCRVTGTNNAVGGLVGYNEGDISFSTSGHYTTGNWYLGGLVGQNNKGTIIGCNSYGYVHRGTGNSIGGLIGRNTGSISSSNNSAFVNGTSRNAVGGLVGWNDGPVDGCNNTADVVGAELIGGITGMTVNGIFNSFSLGNISGTGGNIGGITGQSGEAYSTSAYIINCYNTGDINGGWWYVGGLAGRNYESIAGSYNTGNVTGQKHQIGGIAGFSSKDALDSYNTGSVMGANEVGGIFGFMYTSASITRCYSTGDVQGDNFVGGLAGNSTSSSCLIQESASFGDVTGNFDHVGGVVGRNYHPSAWVTNCYAHGDVTGTRYVGGLAGSNEGQIDRCFSTGAVIGSANTGGLIGWNLGSVNDCYWDNITSQKTKSSGGSGRTPPICSEVPLFLPGTCHSCGTSLVVGPILISGGFQKGIRS